MKNNKRIVAFLAIIMASLMLIACVSCGKKAETSGNATTGNSPVQNGSSGGNQNLGANNGNNNNNGTSGEENSEGGAVSDGEDATETKRVYDEFVETEENIMVEIPIEE
jgi:outer membrane murein-binding lipoprotein Lpp